MRDLFASLAASAGIEYEYHAGGTIKTGPQRGEPYAAEIILDAPPGKVFVSSGCHTDGSLCHTLEREGTRTNWSGAHRGLSAIVACGFTDCPDGDKCDICNPTE